MPKTACAGGFFHVMAIAFFFEMPLNRSISFPDPFWFQRLVTCFFLEMPIFYWFGGAFRGKIKKPSHDKIYKIFEHFMTPYS